MAEFSVGDRVRITVHHTESDYFQQFDGLAGEVLQVTGDGVANVRIEPHSDRPDGHERRPFWWDSDRLELDTPRVGDIVRVVLEGRVNAKTEWGISVGQEDVFIPAAGDDVKSIEIIEKAKPSVADLPVGSVVLSGTNGNIPFARLVNQSKYWYEPGHTDAYVAEDLDKWGWTLLAPKESE